jgi:hypothetical protein
MPEDTAHERGPTLEERRPSMATHWPTPPGGWELHAPDGTPLDPTAPPLPARNRPNHLLLISSVLAGIVGLGLIAGAGFAAATGIRSLRQDREQLVVGMNQPVRDGAFQFTVDGVKCGLAEIGGRDDHQAPTGQFCVVTLAVKNVGTGPAVFAEAIQKAYGAGGVWFSADSEAGLYANPDPTIFFNDINPGNKIRAYVVYDIPPGARIVRLELHENPRTHGALIKIG